MRLFKVLFAVVLAAVAAMAVAAGFVVVAIGALAAMVLSLFSRQLRRSSPPGSLRRSTPRPPAESDAIEVTAHEVNSDRPSTP